MDKLSYEEVIDSLKKKKRKIHLLLGNGFSIAYDSKIFSYNALSQFIETSSNNLVKELFSVIKTSNFEQIMQQLTLTRNIISLFGNDPNLLQIIDQSIIELQNSLINAIEALHPDHVFTIPEEKSASCAKFLQEYLDNDGNIFSTNYDLLLYWILMRNQLHNTIDGFGKDLIENDDWKNEDDPEFSELRWGKHKEKQRIFYLHGALPIFDDGIEIVKEIYDGHYLLENIKKRMDKGQYPVFVTAGDGNEKLNHIVHNHYLSFCYDSLCKTDGSLITYGFNFGDSDQHIIHAINKAASQPLANCLRSVYIGVYSDEDKSHIESIENKFKCKVHIFDSKSARIWG